MYACVHVCSNECMCKYVCMHVYICMFDEIGDDRKNGLGTTIGTLFVSVLLMQCSEYDESFLHSFISMISITFVAIRR